MSVRPGGPMAIDHVAHGITFDGGRVDDEPVYIRARSARAVEHDEGGKAEPVINLTVFPFNTWQVVKLQIKKKWPGLRTVPEAHVRLLYKGVELRPCSRVDDYRVDGGHQPDKPVELQYLVIDKGTSRYEQNGKEEENQDIGLYVDTQVPCTKKMHDRVSMTVAALLHGIVPRLTDDGTGATYLLLDAAKRRVIAVFKPKDEEAFAPQNPRGYPGPEDSTGLRQGVYSTQQAAREVAAYLLDHGSFAGVPETTLVHAKHPKFVAVNGKTVWKIGAFQAFVDTKDTAGNFAPQVFSVSDVQHVGILDMRIVNLDRNDGNLLVKRCSTEDRTRKSITGSVPLGEEEQPLESNYKLIPIDHGLSLPDRLDVYVDDICWMGWPQAHKKFGTKELEYIRGLNGVRDVKLLTTRLGIGRESLRLMEVTTKLLQISAENGLSLYEIGTILYRMERDEKDTQGNVRRSPLERIVEFSLDAALAASGDSAGSSSVVSKTLSGLDLAPSTSARPPGGDGDMGAAGWRRKKTGELHDPALPPPLPVIGSGGVGALPLASGAVEDSMRRQTTDPCSSPSVGEERRLPPPSPAMSHMSVGTELSPFGDDLSHLSLDVSSDENLPSSPGLFATESKRALARAPGQAKRLDEVAESPRSLGVTRPGSSTWSNRHISSSRLSGTVLRHHSALSCRQKTEPGETPPIFSRIDEKGKEAVTWTPDLERAFRRHVADAIADHVKKNFRRNSPPEPTVAGTVAEAPLLRLPSPVSSPVASPHVSFSLASAFPCMPSNEDEMLEEPLSLTQSTPAQSPLLGTRPRYVPPQMRARLQQAELEPLESPEEPPPVELPLAAERLVRRFLFGPPTQPPRARYVPPQQRKAAELGGGGGGSASSSTAAPKRYVPPQRRAAEAAASAELTAAAAFASLEDEAGRQDPSSASAAAAASGVSPCVPLAVLLPTHESAGSSRYGYCVHQGPRKSMEDAIEVVPQLGPADTELKTEYYAVYDGHGGTDAVEFVKRWLPNKIKNHKDFSNHGKVQDVLCNAFHTIDTELLDHLQSRPPPKRSQDTPSASSEGMAVPSMPRTSSVQSCQPWTGGYSLSAGCVGTVALIRGSTITVANLGDCRGILCVDGKARALTRDHCADEHEEEKARLEKLGVEVSSDGYLHGRIAVSRAFGDWAWEAEEKCLGLLCTPDVTEHEVPEETEFLLLVCDGVLEKMKQEEAVQIVRRRLRATRCPKEAAEALVKNAEKRDGSDNLSAVVVIFKLPEPAESTGAPARSAPRLFGRPRVSLADLADAAPNPNEETSKCPSPSE